MAYAVRELSVECNSMMRDTKYSPLGQSPQTIYDLGGLAAEWVLDSDGYRLVGGALVHQTYCVYQLGLKRSNQIDTLSPVAARGARLILADKLGYKELICNGVLDSMQILLYAVVCH